MLQPSFVSRRSTGTVPFALPEALNSRTGWPMVSILLFGTPLLSTKEAFQTGFTAVTFAGTGFAAAGWTGAIIAGTAFTEAAIASAILVTGVTRDTATDPGIGDTGFGGTAADASVTGFTATVLAAGCADAVSIFFSGIFAGAARTTAGAMTGTTRAEPASGFFAGATDAAEAARTLGCFGIACSMAANSGGAAGGGASAGTAGIAFAIMILVSGAGITGTIAGMISGRSTGKTADAVTRGMIGGNATTFLSTGRVGDEMVGLVTDARTGRGSGAAAGMDSATLGSTGDIVTGAAENWDGAATTFRSTGNTTGITVEGGARSATSAFKTMEGNAGAIATDGAAFRAGAATLRSTGKVTGIIVTGGARSAISELARMAGKTAGTAAEVAANRDGAETLRCSGKTTGITVAGGGTSATRSWLAITGLVNPASREKAETERGFTLAWTANGVIMGVGAAACGTGTTNAPDGASAA